MSLFSSNSINIFNALLTLGLITSCSYRRNLTAEDIQLGSYYASNMVFQSGQPIVLKGKCSPKGKLAVLIENTMITSVANENGDWSATFPQVDYKGTFTIKIEGKGGILKELNNVTIGDLWVIIGDNWLPNTLQSYTDTEQSGCYNKDVRYFQPDVNPTNFKSINCAWKVLSPGIIYQYEKLSRMVGERLKERTGKTIGVINLSWPGTHLADFANNKPKAFVAPDNVDYDSLFKAYDLVIARQDYINDSSFNGIEKGALNIRLEDWDWNDLNLPEKTGKRWFLKNRIVWFRKKFYVSDKYRTSNFRIDLGTIRGAFIFYINGNKLGTFEGESIDYSLEVPDSLIRTWTNLLTIRMNTSDSLSGFYSDNIKVINMDSSYKMNINEGWSYKAHLEPRIPQLKLPLWAYPKIKDNIIPLIWAGKYKGIIIAGGYKMISNSPSTTLFDGLKNINTAFEPDVKLLCLPTKISYIDSLENNDYYLKVLNSELNAAAQAGYSLVNLFDITDPQRNEYSMSQITERLINNMDR